MQRTDTIIVGAGQAGLAVSNLLTHAGRDHVLLERGRVGERWRSERWESLQLLTPNWMTRLPGWQYSGDRPDGFMHRTQVVDFFDRYARSFGAPVLGETRVERVSPGDGGYHVVTDQATWFATNVVIATGASDTPSVPRWAEALAPEIDQITPNRYRAPSSVRDGGVLVVGASATGVQLADELARRVALSCWRSVRTRVPCGDTAGSTCSAGSKQRGRTARHSPQSPIRSPPPARLRSNSSAGRRPAK